MTVAVSRAKGRGAEAVICASTGNTAASAAAYAARAGHARRGDRPRGQDRDRQARPGADARRPGGRPARATSTTRCEIVRELAEQAPDRAGQLGQPLPDRGPEDGRLRGRRGARRGPRTRWRSRSATPATSPPTGAASSEYERGARRSTASRPRARRRWCTASRSPSPETVASAIRIGNPARWEEAMDAFTASRGRVAAVSDEQILDAYRLARLARGRLLRAGLGGLGRRPARPRPAGRRGRADARVGRLRAHRPRPQGPRHGARQGARR